MKTQINTALKTLTGIILIALLITAASCTSKEASAQNDTSVKPPQMDIHTAVLTENIDVLRQHIAAGSNLNEKDPFGGSSPLITASVFGKTEMARVLIEAGADLNFQNKDGSTALHTAAFFCRPEIVKMLLDNNADKTIKNNFDATPYQTVASSFSEAKGAYDMMATILGPMGLKLDYAYIEKTRPEIAATLK